MGPLADPLAMGVGRGGSNGHLLEMETNNKQFPET